MSMNMVCAGSVSEKSFFADLNIPYERAMRELSLATFKQLMSAISQACRMPVRERQWETKKNERERERAREGEKRWIGR